MKLYLKALKGVTKPFDNIKGEDQINWTHMYLLYTLISKGMIYLLLYKIDSLIWSKNWNTYFDWQYMAHFNGQTNHFFP